MKKYFAHRGRFNLSEVKNKKIENTRFHLNSEEIAIKRCNRIWGEGKYSLYTFEDYNNNDSYKKII